MKPQLTRLYEGFAAGQVSRREFMRQATALGVAGAAAATLGSLAGDAALAAQTAAAASSAIPLDVAEWSYMWVNVKRADTARGSYIGGQQMYVEYMVPARVRKPYPIVLVHGGGGQGLDWMGTPDGRPGWFQMLVAEGYRVYVVDRPGHGRAPLHPDTHVAFPAQAGTLEFISGRFTPPNSTMVGTPGAYQKGHNQWVGEGTVGSKDLADFVASQGGSYVAAPGGPGGPGGPGRQGGAPAGPPPPANQGPAPPLNIQHAAWRQAGAELLDKIGPAIIMTHSAGGPFGLLVAEARPNLVKATVIIEGAGSGFGGGNRWGMSSIPVTYDPPVSDPSEIKVRYVANPEPGIAGYYLQEEPARQLPNLKNTAVVFVTAANSFASPGNPGGVAFLQQAGVKAEELRLEKLGITGNGHMMMVERNHRAVLQPIIAWMDKSVTGRAPAIKRGSESTALKLADSNYFWIGAEGKKMPYGTIVAGQMYVQYLIPEVVRQPLPIVLVHGGGGQMTHYMGIDGNAGWAHYYVQAGYKVYLVDRPGHGRSPYHPDALGPIGGIPMHAGIAADLRRAATGNPRRWTGTGDIGDPLLDQFQAGQNAAMQDAALAQQLWRSRGGMLLDRIGPAIVQTHSAGGPFGWLTADERPNLVKALVSFEGAGAPLIAQGNQEARALPNVKNIPMMYLTAENSGRTQGPAIVEALNTLGAKAEHINLKDRGITGNGHFAMIETNRKQVFDVIRGWIETKAPLSAPANTTARR
jgi:pimeloyl-ACP methyl ester carboxylesterase